MISSPTQYIKTSLISYPSLYKSVSEDDMKMKIFDQLFNTIGNGIDDDNLAEHLNIKVKSQTDLDEQYKFILENDMYQVFTDDFVIFLSDIFKTEESIEKYPKSEFNWEEAEMYDCSLYPNFQSQYSIAYSSPEIFKQSTEWVETIIWYYTKAQDILVERFNSGYTKEDMKKVISDYSAAFESEVYVADEKETHYDKISKAYETKFNGNIEDFVIRRNEKTLQARIDFCQSILSMYN